MESTQNYFRSPYLKDLDNEEIIISKNTALNKNVQSKVLESEQNQTTVNICCLLQPCAWKLLSPMPIPCSAKD